MTNPSLYVYLLLWLGTRTVTEQCSCLLEQTCVHTQGFLTKSPSTLHFLLDAKGQHTTSKIAGIPLLLIGVEVQERRAHELNESSSKFSLVIYISIARHATKSTAQHQHSSKH